MTLIRPRRLVLAGILLGLGACGVETAPRLGGTGIDYARLAEHIVGALHLEPAERVLIRTDPGHMHELVDPLRRSIRAASAIDIAAIEYAEAGLAGGARAALEDAAFAQLLMSADAYLYLPVREGRGLYPAEARALTEWVDLGGSRRELHFHWDGGSMLADGVTTRHSPEFDRIYAAALDIDYAALSVAQDKAISQLRSGTVRVQTPAGTDISFQLGNRPVNKQNGDASAARARRAQIRVDRHVELPAGVIRVAPLEETVTGQIVVPEGEFGGVTARGVTLRFEQGQLTAVEATENLDAVERYLDRGGDAARRFREFALGMNPALQSPANSDVLPYYGYGAAVVRLSLGDNEELGGTVRGGFVRWFFFPDATVEVDGTRVVNDGALASGS